MKKRAHSSGGMETPVSMFLLFTSALLIASIGDALLWNDSEPNDLFRIRSEQVRSMGMVLATWEPEGGNGALFEMLITSDHNMFFHAGENTSSSGG